jgi:hypothetical protein
MNKQIVSMTRTKCARSRSMRIQHRHVHAEGDDDHLAKHSQRHKKNLTHQARSKRNHPLGGKKPAAPAFSYCVALSSIIQLNPVPLQRFEPKTKKDSCRVYASQVGQSTPSRIRRGPCLAGYGSIQKKRVYKGRGKICGK